MSEDFNGFEKLSVLLPTDVFTYFSPDGSFVAPLDGGIPTRMKTWSPSKLLLDSCNIGTPGANSLLYYSTTSGAFIPITIGSGLAVTGGALTATSVATGNVTGPVTSTENNVARYGANGQTIKDSTVRILDDGSMIVSPTVFNGFVVGRNGTTNPALIIDCSASGGNTGFAIVPGTSSPSLMYAISPSSNCGADFSSKGSGAARLLSNNQCVFRIGSNDRLITTNVSHTFTAGIDGSAGFVRYNFSGAANTGLTASTEFTQMFINFGQTNTHATGNITEQRDIRISPMTHAFSGTSTIAKAATLSVDGAPIAGANATITRSYAFDAKTGVSYFGDGIVFKAPDGGLWKVGVDNAGARVATTF